MNQELRSYEWIVILTFSILILCVGAISYFHRVPSIQHQQITITVKGAVQAPQTIQVPQGTLLAHIMTKVSLTSAADVGQLKLDCALQKDETIIIPSSILSITVEGAVKNPGIYQVPKGAKIEDLRQYITPSEGADASFLKKKRKLKNQETVFVPYKKKLK